MPVTKLPVVHKFGIISHSQRIELQDRLLKQSYIQGTKSKKAAVSTSRNPLEVSDEFVQHFNNAKNLDEKEKYEDVTKKMLERSKRRAGVRDGGTGRHVNLPMAWTELAQLAQCKGKQQDECLDVLITSLEISPLERYHIPALFFLAETMLYWLRTESIHQPYLRTTEIKLLKMGQLVFTRLFYSHMAGQLQGHSEFKNRLFTYLDGLQDCQEVYNPYPNALLSLRFLIEVGKIILNDAVIDIGEGKEGDRLPPERKIEELTQATKLLYEKRSEASSHSAAISSSVHDLSPTLWHSLDVWRCTNQLSGGVADALIALAHCGLGLATENWVDGTIALHILGDAARNDMDAMRALHCLAQGVNISDREDSPPLSSHSESTVTDFTFSDDEGELENKLISAKQQSVHSSRPSLSDINEKSEDSYLSSAQSTSKTTGSSPVPPLDLTLTESSPLPSMKEIKAPRLPYKREVSFDSKIGNKAEKQDKHNSEKVDRKLERSETDKSRSGCQAETGTSHHGRIFSASSVGTFTNIPLVDSPGIYGWHWEVAVTYCEILANICIHGNNVNLQKMALVGLNNDISEPYRRGYGIMPLVSAGLIDLAFFHTLTEKQDGGSKDWSWRLRYGAIQSLVKICRCLANDVNKDGIRNAAWTTLLKAHSIERDQRVLEALKVGQVHTNMDELLKQELTSNPISIGSRIAGGLTTIYLPPLPPPVDLQQPKKSSPKKLPQQAKAAPTSRTKLRTSLKEEIMLATALYEEPVNFNTRTSFDLRRIVEDQWRKELQEKLEEEEVEKRKELKQEQKDEEERQKQVAVNKALKFSKSKPPQIVIG